MGSISRFQLTVFSWFWFKTETLDFNVVNRISRGNHRFRVQFGISLHEWVFHWYLILWFSFLWFFFQKAAIALAASASAISAFWKTHKCKLIPNWTRKTIWLLINNTNMKKSAWKKCWKMFLEALFFAFEKNCFRVSVQNFGHCRLHEIIGLQLSQCLSANHNPELRCVIC